MKNRIVWLGIDPAFRKDGFAVCVIDETGEVNFTVFKSFLDFLVWAKRMEPGVSKIVAVIENSNLQDLTFDMSGSKSVVARKSRNVGANQAASQYTVDACRDIFGEKNTIEISPRQKGAKIVNDVYFRAYVQQNGHFTNNSYKGNKNEQDKRDSYQIAVVGKKMYSFQQARIKVK